MTSQTRQDSTRLKHHGSVASDALTPLGGRGGHLAIGPWESKDFGVSGPATVVMILAVGSGCGSV